MTVIEILESVGLYLDLTDDFKSFSSGTGEITEEVELEVNKILKAINNVIEQLSFNFLNFKTQETVLIEDKNFDLGLLSHKLLKVCSLKIKSNNKKLKFEIDGNYIKTDFDGYVDIEYFYVPNKVMNLNDKILIDSKISESVFVLGVIAEYCFINGLFDDAKVWEEKFLKELNKVIKFNKNFYLPKRGWF